MTMSIGNYSPSAFPYIPVSYPNPWDSSLRDMPMHNYLNPFPTVNTFVNDTDNFLTSFFNNELLNPTFNPYNPWPVQQNNQYALQNPYGQYTGQQAGQYPGAQTTNDPMTMVTQLLTSIMSLLQKMLGIEPQQAQQVQQNTTNTTNQTNSTHNTNQENSTNDNIATHTDQQTQNNTATKTQHTKTKATTTQQPQVTTTQITSTKDDAKSKENEPVKVNATVITQTETGERKKDLDFQVPLNDSSKVAIIAKDLADKRNIMINGNNNIINYIVINNPIDIESAQKEAATFISEIPAASTVINTPAIAAPIQKSTSNEPAAMSTANNSEPAKETSNPAPAVEEKPPVAVEEKAEKSEEILADQKE
ncbi:MAG: hypothetical protein A2287_01125 [Candidatus Melainabacteria bacterium RIFOXYA12_FULL_32_12]|nr:MAG: hypothetical protein A2255_04050 [Candidatus Melainabacteria bacterium RIFOXYA2_FULL_32_9]OGI26798.1 MAG: hypothetical protein A2287_01125 [Candidatus Melainabacteria bacterium RIFOXYA12_FULL_32_12]